MRRESLVALAAAAMLAAVGALPAQNRDQTPDPNRPRNATPETIDRNADPTSRPAADAQTTEQNTTERNTTERTVDEGDAGRVAAQPRTEQLPEFLTQLNLTQQQEQEIRNVLREHDQRAESLWNEFQALHWQAVELEAGLSATHKLSGHDHEAHHARSSAVRQDQVVDNRPQADNGTTTGEPTVERNATVAGQESRPQTAADRFEQEKRARDQRPFGTDSNRRSTTAQANPDQPQGELNIVSLRIGVVQPNGSVREFQLRGSNDSSHDEAGACKVCMAHQRELGELWKRIHQVHNELVQVESDRIVAVEGRLTSEQIDRLRASVRSSATGESPAADEGRTDRVPGTDTVTPPETGEREAVPGSEPRRESTENSPADADRTDNPQE